MLYQPVSAINHFGRAFRTCRVFHRDCLKSANRDWAKSALSSEAGAPRLSAPPVAVAGAQRVFEIPPAELAQPVHLLGVQRPEYRKDPLRLILADPEDSKPKKGPQQDLFLRTFR